VFKFRPFVLSIELDSAYIRREGLTPSDILQAGLSAKCCRESDLNTDLAPCSVCSPGRRVVELGVSDRKRFCARSTGHGTESFVFDSCRSNCSSSRDHHKSAICIVIDGLPHAGRIASPPLVLQAREKQQNRARTQSLLDHSATRTTVLPTVSTPVSTAGMNSASLIPVLSVLRPSAPRAKAILFGTLMSEEQTLKTFSVFRTELKSKVEGVLKLDVSLAQGVAAVFLVCRDERTLREATTELNSLIEGNAVSKGSFTSLASCEN